MNAGAREVALQVVRDVFPADPGTQRGAQDALDYRLRGSNLEPRDRAFATMLAFGAIKMRRTLDWYLAPYLATRGKPLPPTIAEILRLAIYELRFARTPAHASVSQWVGLAKRHGHRGTAGLVNAVLRSFLRDDPPSPARERFESDEEYWGTAYSYPSWIVRQWRDRFGADRIEAILEATNAPAQGSVVINPMRTDRETVVYWFVEHGAQAAPSDFAPDAVLVSDPALARAGEREASGAWWVQSESSAFAVSVLNPQPGEHVADVCSGRGNKALQSAGRMRSDGTLVCVERDARKVKTLQDRAAQAGLPLATIAADASAIAAELRFDRILLDAPCSGVGVVGRHPESRWRKKPEDGPRLAEVQRGLLDALLPRLFEGGALVFAVCSVDPRETHEVIEWALRGHNVQRGLLPAALEAFQTQDGDLLVPPGLGGRDGFYIARLERSA